MDNTAAEGEDEVHGVPEQQNEKRKQHPDTWNRLIDLPGEIVEGSSKRGTCKPKGEKPKIAQGVPEGA